MPGNPVNHLNSPVIAGIDIATVAAMGAYWGDFLAHFVGITSTALAGLWYAYCLYDAIKNKKS